MTQLTPPILTRGIYTVAAPFVVDSSLFYTTTAIRTFTDLLAQAVDPLALVYTPVGLGSSQMQSDQTASANIITLTPDSGNPIYIPSTYITSFPDDTAVEYEYGILTCSLGAIPVSLATQLQQVMDTIKASVSDLIGLEPDVTLSIAPSSGAISAAQYRVNEQNRLAAIRNRTTEHAQLLAAQGTITKQALIIADYEQRIIALSTPAVTPATTPTTP